MTRRAARTSSVVLGNLAACGIDQLAAIVRTRLKSMQYRPGLLDAFIVETGLAVQPQPP
jgi:hypothetical protein